MISSGCHREGGRIQLYVKHFSELSTEELYDILKLRVDVFVVEQNCPYREIDDLDQNAYHVFLRDEDGIEAYLRVLDRGVESEHVALGRVITAKRGLGLGKRIMSEGIRVAKEKYGADKIYLEAQVYARGFYEKSGFRQVSGEFPIDGIPHIKMIREF